MAALVPVTGLGHHDKVNEVFGEVGRHSLKMLVVPIDKYADEETRPPVLVIVTLIDPAC
jgi:hypothetical protein